MTISILFLNRIRQSLVLLAFLSHISIAKGTSDCLEALYVSDENDDDRISKNEYVTFMKLTSPDGLLDGVETYEELPLLFQSTFIALSCYCPKESEGGESCCLGSNPYIPIYEIPQTENEQAFMATICSVTEKAVEQIVEKEQFPTPSPSIATNTPTGKPTFLTDNPTLQPTPAPTTLQPTQSPSVKASEVPTASPTTSQPTMKPSRLDSGAPTPSPTTSAPSGLLTMAPTTFEPTQEPTRLDSGAPTPSPTTSAPSGAPTMAPTTSQPTQSPSVLDSFGPTFAPTTSQPTQSPSRLDSGVPTPSPTTSAPSGVPTFAPTTPKPSQIPSILDSFGPTVAPTTSQPTQEPTAMPSGTPSDTPTATPTAPTNNPTNVPTGVPTTVAPTISQLPSASPSDSSAPTMESLRLIQTSYVIVVPTATEVDSYEADLISAMDIVAAETAKQISTDEADERRLRQRRRLAVRVRLPTLIEDIETAEDGACGPDFGSSGSDRCEQVNAAVTLFLTGQDDTPETAQEFEARLNKNIQDGKLVDALKLINPDSPVSIVTGAQSSPAPETESTGLPAGAIAGIVMAGALIVFGGVFAQRRSSNNQARQQEMYATWVQSKDSELPGPSNKSESDSSEQGYAMPFLQFQAEGDPQAQGAGLSNTMDDENDAVSYENSSGWSDNYSTSMGSMEDSGGQAEKVTGSPPRDGSPSISTRLDELETAMSSGNWSAVGASAAVLAASQQDQNTGRSITKKTSVGEKTNIDKKTAAQLEKMINSGDWEGVIQAAAKMEASSTAGEARGDAEGDGDSASQSDSKGSSGASKSGDASSGSNSVGKYSLEDNGSDNSAEAEVYMDDEEETVTSRSDPGSSSAGGASKQTEYEDKPDLQDEDIRKQVVELVEKVVPEELGNVDEMVAQFHGREHELLETLRTMQERDVALKAKQAAQQQQKLELSEKDEKMMRKLATIEAAEVRAQEQQQEDQSSPASQGENSNSRTQGDEDDEEGSL